MSAPEAKVEARHEQRDGTPAYFVQAGQAGGPGIQGMPAPTAFQSGPLANFKHGVLNLGAKIGGQFTVSKAPISKNQALPETMKAIVYGGPGKVLCKEVPTPTLGDEKIGRMEHGVIIKLIATNICGSDLHMYRGTAKTSEGLVLGHEMTGEVVEIGRDVLMVQPGDIVSVPFNVACGRCTNCFHRKTSACLTTRPDGPGAAYGYSGAGDWRGGQAEYLLVPYADFNLLKFPDKDQAMKRILDLAMLSDILPTGYHGAVSAGVQPGKSVYIAGAGPVGICAAASALILGATKVFVGDPKKERRENVAKLGCFTVDTASETSVADQMKALAGISEVDCSIDCVGYECLGNGHSCNAKVPDSVLHDCFKVTKAGGSVGIPGVYFPPDNLTDAGKDAAALKLKFGEAWNKGLSMPTMGQCPVMMYNKELMKLILSDRMKLSDALNIRLIGLEDVPKAYEIFNKGENCKYIIDPHSIIRRSMNLSRAENGGSLTVSSATQRQEEVHKPATGAK